MTSTAARGGLVARTLAGAWRSEPPPDTPSRTALAEILPFLLTRGVGALAWRRISYYGDAELRDSHEAFELRQAYRLHALHAALHVKQIEDAVSLLRTVGIDPLLAKGWAAARHYPEPGLRPYGDIDLFVNPEQYPAAKQALFRSRGLRLPVDLHPGCSSFEDRTMNALNTRAEPVKIGGVDVRLMGPEDHLHLLCVHALSHGLSRPSWLCDIAAILESCPSSFDWDLFWGQSRRRSAWLRSALVASHHLLGASLGRVPDLTEAPALPHWFVRAVRIEWGTHFRALEPMASFLPHGGRFHLLDALREMRRHWPNPIEATFGVGGTSTPLPRWPYQLAHAFLRTTRLARRKKDVSSSQNVESSSPIRRDIYPKGGPA